MRAILLGALVATAAGCVGEVVVETESEPAAEPLAAECCPGVEVIERAPMECAVRYDTWPATCWAGWDHDAESCALWCVDDHP